MALSKIEGPVEGNGSQQNSPVDKWSEKTSPGALGTKEKVAVLSSYGSSMQTLLNVSSPLDGIVLFLSDRRH